MICQRIYTMALTKKLGFCIMIYLAILLLAPGLLITHGEPINKEELNEGRVQEAELCTEVSVEELKDRLKAMNRESYSLFSGGTSMKKEKTMRVSSLKIPVLRRMASNFRCSFLCHMNRGMFKTYKKKGNERSKCNSCHGCRQKEKEENAARDMNGQCFTKGSIDTQGLIRLCTECPQKKTLDITRYPRELSEISCSAMDSDCLLGDGACVQQYADVIILRKTGQCTVCNGVSRQEWVPEVLKIKVGCSCRLRPGSVFSILLM